MEFVEGVGRRSELENGEFIGWVQVGRRSLNGRENNVMFRNLGGTTPRFEDHAYVSGTDRIEDGRGVGVLDIDSDGDLDLIVQSVEKPAALLVNYGHPTDPGRRGHWLQVRLQGTRSNRDAIGARIELVTDGEIQIREVVSTSGYISSQSLVSHFGLGTHSKVDTVKVFWPSGGTTSLKDVRANQLLRITEGPGSSSKPSK